METYRFREGLQDTGFILNLKGLHKPRGGFALRLVLWGQKPHKSAVSELRVRKTILPNPRMQA